MSAVIEALFPWVKHHRRQVAAATARFVELSAQADEAALRRQDAEVAARQSRRYSDLLLSQVERNGFTDALVNSWRGRT